MDEKNSVHQSRKHSGGVALLSPVSPDTGLLPCPFAHIVEMPYRPPYLTNKMSEDGNFCVYCPMCSAATGFHDYPETAVSYWSGRSVQSGWQPIETAPKDGRRLLLIDADGDQVVGFYGKHNHVPIYGWIRPVELYSEEVDGFDATHWMLLPPSLPPSPEVNAPGG